MLPKQHRLTRAVEFRRVVKTGRRRPGASAMTHVMATTPEDPARFGFIVSKAVGGAVTRNLVKRRLRSVAAEGLRAGFGGADVVVRALPGAGDANYANLRNELCTQLGLTPSEQVTA